VACLRCRGDDDRGSDDDSVTSDEGVADEADDETADTARDADGALVDTDSAQPGTWPVGDAGTVTFEVVDGLLTLEDHEAADGWEATVDEQDDDEIEVDFTQDGARWEFEVEMDYTVVGPLPP